MKGKVTHKLENNYITKDFPQEWDFWDPHQAHQHEDNIWLWRPMEIGCKSSTGLGGNRFHSWRVHMGCKAEQWLHRSLSQINLWVFQGQLGKQESAVAHCRRQGHWWQRPQGMFISKSSLRGFHLGKHHLDPPNSLQASMFRCLRPNKQDENTAPVISRQTA